jgi:poly(3-hydroxybutyrate) depolymerase
MLAFALLACAPPDASDPPAGDDVSPDPLGGTAPLAEPSAGACPDLSDDGNLTFTSDGEERKVKLIYPSTGAAGAPVLFVWHPLGSNARQMVNWMDLDDWAEENGFVVVAPDSLDSNLFEWDFWNDGTHDVTMYDDLRTCLYREEGVDLARVSSTGMSAGGLWTTWLGIHRGDTLATIAPFSGGIEDGIVDYETPAGDFPAMLSYGGDTDEWDGGGITIDFATDTLAFADALKADGHNVVLCDHGLGHTIPVEAPDMMTTWLAGRKYGDTSASADGLPDWCAVY